MPPAILRLGDPRLRRLAAPVDLTDRASVLGDLGRLHAELAAFRAANGFGRAIAAPQLGIDRRMIAMNLGTGPLAILDPEIVWRSRESFTLWDDCLCFPELLVRVRRHASISVRYRDEHGRTILREHLPRGESELFQHEIDHLDGILAVDRAEGDPATITREQFAADPARFAAMVDALIGGPFGAA